MVSRIIRSTPDRSVVAMRFPLMTKSGAAVPWHRARLQIVLSPSAGSRVSRLFHHDRSAAPALKSINKYPQPSSFCSPTKFMGFSTRPNSTRPHNYKYLGIDLPLRESDVGSAYTISDEIWPEDQGDMSCLLQIREVAMMILMDHLTDKPKWHEKVFNQDIVDAWRRDTFAQSEEAIHRNIIQDKDAGLRMPARTRIISTKAFDHCIAELRNKAAFFKETGITPTLDADRFAIFKSDTLVTRDLHHALEASFGKLMADQASNPDWHPRTEDMVWDIVHPSLYPFVYNRSRFIHEEVVGVADAIDRWSGKGHIPIQNLDPPTNDSRAPHHQTPEEFWSEKYQWLPANLAFRQDGSVRFTSYINNLHPQRYSDIYTVIEKLIGTAIPVWDRTLDSNFKHSKPDPNHDSAARISRFDFPPECEYNTPEDEMWEKFDPEVLKAVESQTEVPCSEQDIEDYVNEKYWCGVGAADKEFINKWREKAIPQVKWRRIRDPILPEPDHIRQYDTDCGENIKERFKETGLQVIVKMASIELTPQKPTLPPGGWHVEGQLNERIVATALYYVDEENIEPTTLSFEKPTNAYQDKVQYRVGQDMYELYNHIFGARFGPASSPKDTLNESSLCLQHYGSVETKPGRLLAFPNTFQHRVSGCTLKDKTKPGHRRFIALWLVNPEMRIISTANVPPQQLDWWLGSVMGEVEKAVKGQIPQEVMQLALEEKGETGIPPEGLEKPRESHASKMSLEILDRIRDKQTLDALMSVEEARQYRIALMEERTRHAHASEGTISIYNSFCEH